MEPTPAMDIPRPGAVPPQENGKFPLGRAGATALILIVLAAIGAGAYWLATHRPEASPFPKGATVTASLGYVPASTLFTLNAAHTAFAMVELPGQPEGTLIIDRERAGGIDYYLLLNPQASVSTLYRQEGAALVPMTTSQTIKFDLSYDPASGSFAYLSKAISSPEEFLETSEWDVTVLSQGTERTLGTGLHAEAIPSGVLAGTRDGKLYWFGYGGEEALVLERENAWVFAVNESGTELASYNTFTNQVDRFDLSRGPRELTPRSAEEGGDTIIGLAYMQDSIVTVRSDSEASATMFGIAGTDQAWRMPHPNPEIPSRIFNLSIDL